jgi:hypothetical protein
MRARGVPEPRARTRRGATACEESIGAQAVGLTPDGLREIEATAPRITVHGDRYSEGPQRMIHR